MMCVFLFLTVKKITNAYLFLDNSCRTRENGKMNRIKIPYSFVLSSIRSSVNQWYPFSLRLFLQHELIPTRNNLTFRILFLLRHKPSTLSSPERTFPLIRIERLYFALGQLFGCSRAQTYFLEMNEEKKIILLK